MLYYFAYFAFNWPSKYLLVCSAFTLPHCILHFTAGISENGVAAERVNRVQVSRVEHTQGPWDGSLYATVNKQHRTEAEAGITVHNGPSHIPNGSLTSSVDSGASLSHGLSVIKLYWNSTQKPSI